MQALTRFFSSSARHGYFGLCIACGLAILSLPAMAGSGDVNITAKLRYVDTLHNNKLVRIERNQDHDSVLPLEFSFTSRACPPYCVQPMQISPGVETIGELELLEYLKKIGESDEAVMVIDSREARWLETGAIPGSTHLPWTLFHSSKVDAAGIARLFEKFDVIRNKEIWDFNFAKTLVFYCNGPWCGQSPTSIRSLLTAGYPANRIKWYRGGMQSWLQFGLTVVTPEKNKKGSDK